MKKLLLSTVLVLGMMSLTTGCSDHNCMGEKKCGASGKCNQGKCGSKSDAKKCGSSKDAKKCGSN